METYFFEDVGVGRNVYGDGCGVEKCIDFLPTKRVFSVSGDLPHSRKETYRTERGLHPNLRESETGH